MFKWKWLRDFFILPIVVGIILSLFQLIVSNIQNRKSLFIGVEGPFDLVSISNLLDKSKVRLSFSLEYRMQSKKFNLESNEFNADKVVEESSQKKDKIPPKPPRLKSFEQYWVVKNVKDIQLYRVSILNTGQIPLINLPVTVVFESEDKNLQIHGIQHKTKPQHEFGEINEDLSDISKTRFIYSLLNPGDEYIITFLLSVKTQISVFSKTKRLSVQKTIIKNKYVSLKYTLIWGILGALLITTFLYITRNELFFKKTK